VFDSTGWHFTFGTLFMCRHLMGHQSDMLYFVPGTVK